MRITLNELRRIIREALDENISEPRLNPPLKFEEAQARYSQMILDAMRDNRGNIPALQDAMRAITDQLPVITGWSVEEIQARTQRETGERIAAMKAMQGKVIGEAMISDLGPGGMVIINQERPDSFVIKIREQGAPRSLGHIRLTRKRVDEGSIWEVEDAQAKSGWGPLLYDLAMEYVSSDLGDLGITPDSSQVSGDAQNVWSFYFENRGDVEKEPLPKWKWPHSEERPEYLAHYYYKIDRTLLDKFEASGALKFVQE